MRIVEEKWTTANSISKNIVIIRTAKDYRNFSINYNSKSNPYINRGRLSGYIDVLLTLYFMNDIFIFHIFSNTSKKNENKTFILSKLRKKLYDVFDYIQ
jgi:hypothetical protein